MTINEMKEKVEMQSAKVEILQSLLEFLGRKDCVFRRDSEGNIVKDESGDYIYDEPRKEGTEEYPLQYSELNYYYRNQARAEIAETILKVFVK